MLRIRLLLMLGGRQKRRQHLQSLLWVGIMNTVFASLGVETVFEELRF
jgi:hypothetical protein